MSRLFIFSVFLLVSTSAALKSEIVEVPDFPEFKYDHSILLNLGRLKSVESIIKYLSTLDVKTIFVSEKGDSDDPNIPYYRHVLKTSRGAYQELSASNRKSIADEKKLNNFWEVDIQIPQQHLILLREASKRYVLLHEAIHYLFVHSKSNPTRPVFTQEPKTAADFEIHAKNLSQLMSQKLSEEFSVNQILLSHVKELKISEEEQQELLLTMQSDPANYQKFYTEILEEMGSEYRKTLHSNDEIIQIFNTRLERHKKDLSDLEAKFKKHFEDWLQKNPPLIRLAKLAEKRIFLKSADFESSDPFKVLGLSSDVELRKDGDEIIKLAHQYWMFTLRGDKNLDDKTQDAAKALNLAKEALLNPIKSTSPHSADYSEFLRSLEKHINENMMKLKEEEERESLRAKNFFLRTFWTCATTGAYCAVAKQLSVDIELPDYWSYFLLSISLNLFSRPKNYKEPPSPDKNPIRSGIIRGAIAIGCFEALKLLALGS